MAAAAELGADFRCVHLGSGPDGNFKTSILLFPHSNADFHSFHLAGQGGNPVHILIVGPRLTDHFPRNISHGALSAKVKAHSIQHPALDLQPGSGFGVEHHPVDHRRIRALVHHMSRHNIGPGGGVGITETAGIRGDAGINAIRDLRGDLRFHGKQQIIHDLGRITYCLAYLVLEP